MIIIDTICSNGNVHHYLFLLIIIIHLHYTIIIVDNSFKKILIIMEIMETVFLYEIALPSHLHQPPNSPPLSPTTKELSRDFEQRFSTPQRAEGNDTQAIVFAGWWREQRKRRSPSCFGYTPQKFNMEPENQPLEKETPFGNHDFQVPC